MASLIFEISTQDYDKAKYLKETQKAKMEINLNRSQSRKKANGNIRTMLSNLDFGAKKIINAGTLMTASRTYRIMPIF